MARDSEALLLQLSADIRGLEKQFKRAQDLVDKGSGAMERRARQASTNLERFFGKTDPAKALDKVFDATRFKVLDSGIAKVGIMGGALESLGPAGLAAAAGIGAVALAFAGARDAAKYADAISDVADAAHVTTDFLQGMRYAIRAAGGEEAGADAALQSFSETLGKAQGGLAKAQKGFLLLGFTKAQIEGFTDVESTLPKVAAAMQGLSDAQKDAAVSLLGLGGLKQLLEKGPEQMARFVAQARDLGLVMDANLIKRGGELNDQFETVAKVIEIQLKSALIDLGPILLGLLQKMADLAKEASLVADAFKPIQERSSDNLATQFNRLGKRPFLNMPGRRVEILQELLSRSFGPGAGAPGSKPSKSLTAIPGTPPRDDTAQRTESVNAAVAGAARDLLQAQARLTGNLEARAEIEKQVADQELAEALARINKQKADIDADKGISEATKQALTAQLDEAATSVQSAAAAKKTLIDREAWLAITERSIAIYQETVEAQIAQLEVEAGIATTAAQRAEIEKRILELRQQMERDLKGSALDRDLATGAITPEQHSRESGALDQSQAAARRQFEADHLDPVQQYLKSIQDLNTEMQSAGVQAITSLADGLADAIVNAKSLGDVAGSVFRQLIAQVLSALIQKEATTLVAAVFGVPAFAGGTNFAPGGLALVGERGPEVVNVPRGSQVIPNHTLRSMANLGQPQGRAAGVDFRMTIDLTGANGDETIRAIAFNAAKAGASQAYAAARRDIPADMYRRASRRLGL